MYLSGYCGRKLFARPGELGVFAQAALIAVKKIAMPALQCWQLPDRHRLSFGLSTLRGAMQWRRLNFRKYLKLPASLVGSHE